MNRRIESVNCINISFYFILIFASIFNLIESLNNNNQTNVCIVSNQINLHYNILSCTSSGNKQQVYKCGCKYNLSKSIEKHQNETEIKTCIEAYPGMAIKGRGATR